MTGTWSRRPRRPWPVPPKTHAGQPGFTAGGSSFPPVRNPFPTGRTTITDYRPGDTIMIYHGHRRNEHELTDLRDTVNAVIAGLQPRLAEFDSIAVRGV